jgi:hypothetical protein
MSEKICISCCKTKPLDLFTKSNKSKDGTRNKCKECSNEALRDSVRKYRANNLEKIRLQQKEKYHENIELGREKQREKYRANVDRRKQSAKTYALENMEKRRAWDRAWRAVNSEHNKEKLKKRRSLLKGLDGFDRFVLDEAAQLCVLRQSTTKILWEIDHIVPVSKGGTSVFSNIQVVPKTWNASKGARHTDRFLG